MSSCNYLVKNGYQKVGMWAGEHRNVHGHGGCVRFIQSNAEIPFARQQQQNEYTNMHETHPSCENESKDI